MANYDAVAGVDQSTLNRMSDQLYEIIYPLVFKAKPGRIWRLTQRDNKENSLGCVFGAFLLNQDVM